jgi:hypothetical protein
VFAPVHTFSTSASQQTLFDTLNYGSLLRGRKQPAGTVRIQLCVRSAAKGPLSEMISSSHANPLQTQRASLVSASQVRHVDELVTVQAKKM